MPAAPQGEASLEPLLAKVLRGEKLAADALRPLSQQSLVRLRNAPYVCVSSKHLAVLS